MITFCILYVIIGFILGPILSKCCYYWSNKYYTHNTSGSRMFSLIWPIGIIVVLLYCITVSLMNYFYDKKLEKRFEFLNYIIKELRNNK